MSIVNIVTDASFSQKTKEAGCGIIFKIGQETFKVSREIQAVDSAHAEIVSIMIAIKIAINVHSATEINIKNDCESIIKLINNESKTSNIHIGRTLREIRMMVSDLKAFNASHVRGHARKEDSDSFNRLNKEADYMASMARKSIGKNIS